MVTRTQVAVSKGDLVALARKLHEGIPTEQVPPEDAGALLTYLREVGSILEPCDKRLFQMGDIALARKIAMDVSGLVTGEQTPEQAVAAAKKPAAPPPPVQGKNRYEIFAEVAGKNWTRKEFTDHQIRRWKEEHPDKAVGMEKIAATRISQYTGLLVTLGLGKWVGGKWVYGK